MKTSKRTAVIGVLIGSLSMPFFNGAVAAGSKSMVEPIFTRYARIYQAPTLDFGVEFFKDKPLEEATNFDGYTLTLDFTWPINDRSQIEVFLPLYTEGEANLATPLRHPVDIEGYNGVNDFFSLIYERRFTWLEGVTGVNVAWLAGIGWSLDPLEVTLDNGIVTDRYNHSGSNVQIGLKFDDDIRGGDMTLLGNLRLAMYRDTDDLNLSDGDSNFNLLSATGAVMFNQYGRFTPVLEAILEADFKDYVAFSLAPEAIYTFGDSLDVKLGIPFRLTSDGQKYAANLEMSYRF